MTPSPLSTGRRAARTPAASALVFALAAACSDSSGPVRGEPGVRIVSGGSGSDTVLTVRAEPLVVEVRDSAGRPARGEIVRFETPPRVDEPDATRRHLYVCKEPSNCTWIESNGNWHVSLGADAVTDRNGRAQMLVQHGTATGAGTVAVTARDLGYTATASYTTLPGAIARITAPSLDTAVFVGASFAADARAADRFGNARTEAVSLEALTPSVASVSEGRVTGVSEGRARVVLRVGDVVDTLFVSVPPAGRLALSQAPLEELLLISTDGSAPRRLALTKGVQGYGNWAFPSWSADGRRVLFQEGAPMSSSVRTFAVDTATGARAAVIDTALFEWARDVRYTRAGDALFFYGNGPQGHGIYRANGDGSGATLVVPNAWEPAVSPDGARIAYRPYSTAAVWPIVVRDLATGQTATIVAEGLRPSWSPAGDLIAYTFLNESGFLDLAVVRPDGTGRRVVATRVNESHAWSPDGAWIATGTTTLGVWLVRVADGLRLSVPGTIGPKQVSWRP